MAGGEEELLQRGLLAQVATVQVPLQAEEFALLPNMGEILVPLQAEEFALLPPNMGEKTAKKRRSMGEPWAEQWAE